MSSLDILGVGSSSSILPSVSAAGKIIGAASQAKEEDISAQSVSFSDLLQQAITGTVTSDYDTKAADLGLMVGAVQDLHTIGLAGQKAEIMLNLTVQIRDRVVEAYQEIMRMQI